jgi:hypothetical protein
MQEFSAKRTPAFILTDDKMKNKKTYIIFPDWESAINNTPYEIDYTDWDVSKEELELNVMEQIYFENGY